MSRVFVFIFVLMLSPLSALANQCQRELNMIDGFWAEVVRDYTRDKPSGPKRQAALAEVDKWKYSSAQNFKSNIDKLNAADNSNAIRKTLKEIEDWTDANNNDQIGYGEFQYLKCLAQQKIDVFDRDARRSGDGRSRQDSAANRKVQKLVVGPVSVTLTPNNRPIDGCYDIAFENKSAKYIDFFIRLKLTNRATGEFGTSDWIGENTRVDNDGLFVSANVNKLAPRSSTKSAQYNTGSFLESWVYASRVSAFPGSPPDLYGFQPMRQSCDEVSAELPPGGLRWNENAIQFSEDAGKKKR